MRVSRLFTIGLAVFGVVVFGAASGCGSESAKPESIASESRTQQFVEMRKIFDRAGGQWESLSAEDKAEYTRLAGDEAKAQAMWKTMATPAGGAPGQ